MRKHISLDDVRCFVEVVRRGTFTAAADAMDMSIATFSRRVGLLEQALGFTLLLRSTRKVSLTQVGEHFYQECIEGIDSILTAKETIQTTLERPEGRLKVSILPGLTAVVPGVVQDLRRQYPQLTYEIELGGVASPIEHTGFDVSIRGGMQKDSKLIQKPLAEMRRILVASRSYLARAGRLKAPSDLLNHEIMGSGDETMWELRRDVEVQRVPVSAHFASNSTLLGVEIAAQGGGIAWVPCHIGVDKTIDAHDLERVLPQWELSPITLYALYESRVISARAKAFQDTLVRHMTHAVSSPILR
ncbi:LysR family transcriptional regulator [Bordetella tumulicola]|uniref:LysR family transcriptional regulator n=1 Tax=Bordetella tumulicola TaxID=1649133 RepID=UPI0039F0A6E9